MSSGRDLDPAAEASDGDPESVSFADCEFIGPLRPDDQAWAEHVLRADTSAALFEPVDNVIRRREAHVSGLYRMASLLALSGDLTASGAAGFRAVAEARALAEFMAASPAYCLDCFLLGDRCQRHQASGTTTDFGAPAAGVGSPEVESGIGSTGTASAGTGSTEAKPGSSSTSSSGTGLGSTGSSSTPTSSTGPSSPAEHQPEWRRFGADEFPSAGG